MARLEDLKDRKRISKLARRNVSSEVSLNLSAGFSLIAVILFFFAGERLAKMSESMEMSFTALWIGAAFSLAAVWAWVHHRVFAAKIADARRIDAAHLHSYETSRSNTAKERK